jgi:hypothetical protein
MAINSNIDSKLVWVKTMARGQCFPLDSTEIWPALGDASTEGTAAYYAKNDPTAYVGQTLKVVEGGTVGVYVIIDEAGTLVKVAFETNLTPVFVGTTEEYNKKETAGKIAVGTIVIITDDIASSSSSTSATLGQAILGYMKLGQI